MNVKKEYINFFKEKGHVILESDSLVPDNETTLFTSAGIQQLVPYMVKEEKHPTGDRLTNCQKCLRLSDIENIGDGYHHTFFEMLGNWSMDDYFKNEVIEMSYEFLTKRLLIDPNMLAISVFKGDNVIPRDDDAAKKWNDLGIQMSRIAFLGYEDNWWPSVKEKGPCGTDTEIFYWRSKEPVPDIFDPNDDRWVEIWNNVFIQYNRDENNNLVKLNRKYIDTGMGVERITAILEGYDDNYQTELFKSSISTIENYSEKKYDDQNKKYMRIISDHIRSVVMICSDDKNLFPSNKDRGYILRRLIRRILISSYKLNINDSDKLLEELISKFIEDYSESYPYIKDEKERITNLVRTEGEKFSKVLKQGEKRINKALEVLKKENINYMAAEIIFKLYETYGVPFDLTYTLLNENNINYSAEEVEKLFEMHKSKSKKNSEKKFGNGISKNDSIKVLKRNI